MPYLSLLKRCNFDPDNDGTNGDDDDLELKFLGFGGTGSCFSLRRTVVLDYHQ